MGLFLNFLHSSEIPGVGVDDMGAQKGTQGREWVQRAEKC